MSAPLPKINDSENPSVREPALVETQERAPAISIGQVNPHALKKLSREQYAFRRTITVGSIVAVIVYVALFIYSHA